MPDASIDTLQIQIGAEASTATSAIDRLVSKLNLLSSSMGRINGSNFKTLSSSAKTASNSINKLNYNRLTKGMNSYTSSTKKASSATNKFASSLGKMYASFWPVFRALQQLGKAITSSMNYIEILNYFNNAWNQVAENADLSAFEELGYESAEAYINSFSERAKQVTTELTGFSIMSDGSLLESGQVSLGINPTQVMNYQAMFGQMASSIGITAENSLLLSEALTKIGADLASVKNMEFEEVWRNMASGLAGMSRTLDKYGVNIRNVNLQQKLWDLGINENIANLNQNDKALLRTIILLESTGYAYGDLAETISQPANQLRLLKANFSNLARTIGNLFLPVVQTVLPYINGLVIALQRLFVWVGNLIGIDFSKLMSSVSSVGGADFSDLIGDTDDLEDSLDNASKSAKKLKDYTLGIDELNIIKPQEESGGVGGLSGGAGGLLNDAFLDAVNKYLEEWDKAFAEVENRAQEIANNIMGFFMRVWKYAEPARIALNNLWNEGLALFGDFAIGTISDFYHEFLVPIGKWTLGEGLPRFFDITNKLLKGIKWDKLRKSLSDFYEVLSQYQVFVWTDLLNFYEHFLVPIGQFILNDSLPFLLDTLSGFGKKINWEKLNSAFSEYYKIVSKFRVGIGKGFINFLEAITPFLTSVLATIVNSMAVAFEYLFKALNSIPESVFIALGGAIAGILITFETYKGVTSIMESLELAWISLYVAFDDGLKLLMAHPLGVLVGSISAVVGAIVALEEQAQQESQISKYGDTIANLAGSFSKVSDEIERNVENIRNYVDNAGLAETRMIENLTDKYYELAEQESLTADNKADMATITSQLVDLMPELNQYIDEETGLITAQKDEVLKLVEAKREQYRAEAVASQMRTAYEEQLKAEQNLAEVLEKTKTAQQSYNDELAEYNAQRDAYYENPIDFGIEPSYQGVIDAKEEWKALSSELTDAKEAYDSVGETITWLEEQMYSSGENAVAGFSNGISENANKTVTDIDTWMKEVDTAIHDSVLEFGSPSKKTWQYGSDTITGFNNGITENQQTSQQAIDSWLLSISDMFTAERWSEVFSGMSEGFTLKWDEMLKTWSETTMTEWFDEGVKQWFSKEKWVVEFDNIRIALESVWDEIVNWWDNSAISRWYNDSVKPWFALEKWTSMLSNVTKAFKSAFKESANGAISYLNGIIAGVEKMINEVMSGFKKMVQEMNSISEVNISFSGSNVSLSRIPMYFNGGFPKSASLFWSGENGVPEMVGTIGGSTAVASGAEITGIRDAVYDTGQAEVDLLQTAVSLLQVIASKDMTVNIDERGIVTLYDTRKARNGYEF